MIFFCFFDDEEMILLVVYIEIEKNSVICIVVKDVGDDLDVIYGVFIVVMVSFSNYLDICFL